MHKNIQINKLNLAKYLDDIVFRSRSKNYYRVWGMGNFLYFPYYSPIIPIIQISNIRPSIPIIQKLYFFLRKIMPIIAIIPNIRF